MDRNMGRLLVIAGAVIIVTGLFLICRDSVPFLKHLGRLPGDIRIKRENFSFYFPVVTCIVLSIIASIILHIIGKFK